MRARIYSIYEKCMGCLGHTLIGAHCARQESLDKLYSHGGRDTDLGPRLKRVNNNDNFK
jgi:hypothetical protein